MFDEQQLLDWLHDDELSLRDKFLLCLAASNCSEKTETEICKLAADNGWSFVDDKLIMPLAVCGILLERETKGYATRIGFVWKLLTKGREYVSQLVARLTNQPAAAAASTLRDVLDEITGDDARCFVNEAIRDVEHGSYRSAVVLSWCGAVALLRDHILNEASLLAAFNTEAKKNKPKWKDVKVSDDFGRMKEYDFLQILAAVSSEVSKDLKLELEKALQFRNSCGHPNSLVIDPHMVQAHLAMLARNVFAKFG